MSLSSQLFEQASKLIPGGVNSPVRAFRNVGGTPFYTVHAEGAYLHDADGRQLLDFVCTWGPAIHGHNHPAIRDAIREALDHGTSFGTCHPGEVAMANLLCQLVPSIEKVRLCNSGTEATMSCIRLARGATKRDKIVKFAGCYHGHVDALLVKAGSGALTGGHPDSAGIPACVAADTLVLPLNDTNALENLFIQQGERIAAIILEPYPANVGLILPDPGFLQQLRNITTKYGSLLIFDEVMTGFRITLGGVQEKEKITPDLTALGKIIGGGLPVGAFGGRADIMMHLAPQGPVYQAGTLSGNPLATAAGLASLKLLQETMPYERLNNFTSRLAKFLHAQFSVRGIPVQVPHTGSMFSLYFTPHEVRNYEQAIASDKDVFKRFFHSALEAGIYLPPSPFETCFVSTAHLDPEVEETLYERLENAFKRH
jgi:glutamate-1-semialdehyde 2,1-aminomutase